LFCLNFSHQSSAMAAADGRDLAVALLTAGSGWKNASIIHDMLSRFVPSGCRGAYVEGNLPDDETFEDNVNFVKQTLGTSDVKISKDLPEFHSGCAFTLKPGCIRHDIDTAMKAGMMKVMMDVTKMQQSNGGFISWSKLQELFDSGVEWSPRPGSDTFKMDYIQDSQTRWSVGGGSYRHGTADDILKVQKSMSNFVSDPHIWTSLKIDQAAIGKAFGETGAACTGLASFFAATENRAHIAIDVGCVRFPDDQCPHFKIYRFRVIVMNSCTRVLLGQSDSSAMMMTLTTRTYDMAPAFAAKFQGEVAKKIDDKFDSFMADLGI